MVKNGKHNGSGSPGILQDYQKMSRAELLTQIGQLQSRHASQSKAREKRSSIALNDREKRLQAILDTAVEGIITIDERGHIESVNAAAEKSFGYKSRELIGKNISVLMPSPDKEQHDSYIGRYLQSGHAKVIGIGREVSGRRKDGTIFPMDLSVSEVKLADRRLFTGFVRDISERKQLEKQMLEISEREQRRIGHDLHDGLCQQLAGIEMMSQVLEQKLKKHSKSAAAQAGEIATYVREAIRHTRSLARGLSPVISEPEGLMSALNEMANRASILFRVKCRFESEAEVPVRDHAVATNLFRIAQEAVTNAIKHGKAKQIIIRLRLTHSHILLAVSDNGIGLAAKPKKGGMGLSIMKERAGMIGGVLSIEPNPAGGVNVFCSVLKRSS